MRPRKTAAMSAGVAIILTLTNAFWGQAQGQDTSPSAYTGLSLRTPDRTQLPSEAADRAKQHALDVLKKLGGTAAKRANTLANLPAPKVLEQLAVQPPVGPSTIAAPKPGTSIPSAAVNWIGTGGGATTAHPGIVLLLAQRDGENEFAVQCSGTLVRQNIILTAAHCVCYPAYPTVSVCQNGTDIMPPAALLDASRWRVFLQHVGVRRVTRVDINDNYLFGKDQSGQFSVRGDIAVLVLSHPVAAIIPAAIPEAADAASAWISGLVAGFGFSANPDNPNATVLEQLIRPGLKSQGEITSVACNTESYLDPVASLCSKYATAAAASQATLCSGDSGGPLWMTGNILPQIGVTSGSSKANCTVPETLAFQMSVTYRPHWNWISQRLTELGSASERGRWPAFGENLRFVLDRRNAGVFDANGNYTSGWVRVEESSVGLATMNSSGIIKRFSVQDRTGKELCKGVAGKDNNLPNVDYCSAPITAGQQLRVVAQGTPYEHLQYVMTSHPIGTSFEE